MVFIKQKTINISSKDSGQRLDKFLSSSLSELSRSLIQKLVKENLILVNKKSTKSGYKLKKNDEVVVSVPDLKDPEVKAEDIPLEVVYEDKDLIVVNKSVGMVTHPASGHYEGTLVNALLSHCKGSLSGINGILRPGIVHRLDKETSGLIIACKNNKSHNEIARQIKSREIKKYYLAIVHGKVKYKEGTINKPIGRHKVHRHKMAVVKGGRSAVTRWRVSKDLGKYTLLELDLETGRTHQIRVHLTSIGYPVVGDKVYGKKNDTHAQMMLHSYKLIFTHPVTKKKITLETKIPERFNNLLLNHH